MTAWEEAIEARTFQFIEELERRGFGSEGRTLTGLVGEDSASVRVQIVLPYGFPFAPPIVSPPADFPRSWHRELNGAMCLYPADGRENLPWLDVDDFIETVARWTTESVNGWTNDFPDLDLDRYFTRVDEHLVVYGDLDELNNKFVQLRHVKHLTRVTGPGSSPNGRMRVGKDRSFGFVTDIGEPNVPPTSWEELKVMIPSDDAKAIGSAVRDRRFHYLVVRYIRGGVAAAVVLKVWKDHSGAVGIASVKSASEAPTTLTLRAGSNANRLVEARVAVVGVGAIGSFVCDLLARSGIGEITAYDPDVVRPGNLIRHLADADLVGLAKPAAVKQVIESRPYNATKIHGIAEGLPPPSEMMSLFVEHDLVIDASASGGVSHLLAEAAIAGGHRLLSVCLQEEGSVVRVDVIPPLHGNVVSATELGPPPAREDLRFEAGCGDPVSQTPAFAVFEAASLATRHAIGLMTGSPISGAGTVRDYR